MASHTRQQWRIDPNKTWRLVTERLAAETDPVCQRNLELVLAHMKAEARGDIDGVLATLCPTPQYWMQGATEDPVMNPSSTEGVRAFYDKTVVTTGAHRLEFDCDRVIVDHHAVLTEGRMRQAYPGTTLAAMGIPIDDTDAYYLTDFRMAVVWPIDAKTGLLTGEEVYTVGPGFTGITDRKITSADIAPIRD
ncbi:MAG: nuclear transport factor 2 family protein [Acidimicrobiales bacterium]|nr:nuclear transport factor 2 family protein [Acidimicrobiales bacterium]